MRDQLLAQLRQARERGQAVLFSSHVLSEAEQVCDRVGILQQGRLAHVQNMAELREAHLITLRFAGSRPQELPDLAGLQLRERKGNEVRLEYRGVLGPLLCWLAGQEISDLRVQPLGLSAIYHRYHGVDA
jgi:ABC-2 type transport system ATP-binding protein